MDIKDNKYKLIVNSLIENAKLEKSIGNFIEENYEEESKIDYIKARKIRLRNSIITALSVVLLLFALVILVVNKLYPMTPRGVVRQYIYAVELDDMEDAERYVKTDYEMNHDFLSRKEFSFKLVYNDHRHPKNNKKSTVDLWVEYLDEEVDEYLFWLEKSDGKWYIVERDNVIRFGKMGE